MFSPPKATAYAKFHFERESLEGKRASVVPRCPAGQLLRSFYRRFSHALRKPQILRLRLVASRPNFAQDDQSRKVRAPRKPEAGLHGAPAGYPSGKSEKGPGLKPGASTGRCFATIRSQTFFPNSARRQYEASACSK